MKQMEWEFSNKFLTLRLKEDGNTILILGDIKGGFGASLYMKKMYGKIAGVHPEVDFTKELALWDTVIEANSSSLLESAKDVNIGGIAISLAKMATVGNKGAKVSIELTDSKDIFSESLSRAIVEVKEENIEAFTKLAQSKGISCTKIGTVGGDIISINDVTISLEKAKDIYFNKFKKVIEQDL